MLNCNSVAVINKLEHLFYSLDINYSRETENMLMHSSPAGTPLDFARWNRLDTAMPRSARGSKT